MVSWITGKRERMKVTIFVTAALAIGLSACGRQGAAYQNQCETDSECEGIEEPGQCVLEDAMSIPCEADGYAERG